MKNIRILPSLAALAMAPLLQAGTAPAPMAEAPPTLAEEANCCCHDNNAPIGVMFDHTHQAGGWMVGYRYFYSSYEGLRQGSDSISTHDVFHHGFMATPIDMDMHMHMIEVMYSPTDWLTLMVMPMYMEMNMTMQANPMMAGMMSGHMAHMHAMPGSTFSHSSTGWSDTNVSAIFRLWNSNHNTVLGTLGMNIPTGSVDEKMNGTFTHYMMQQGSGTWDLTPSVTYKGHAGHVFWGAQYYAALRLEDENESGYRLGNVHQVTAWAGVPLTEWAALTGRILYRHEGQIHGHYNGPHNHRSPPDLAANYGGDTLDLGVGLNVTIPRGIFKGNRLSIEALWPVAQDLNGIQLERDFSLVAGWQWSF